MAHVFVAPHPDDVALSCGGLIASLRELGQNVTILTVYSGSSADDGLTDYQREALGFGTKALWPDTEAFNRDDIRADEPIAASPGQLPPWAATEDRLESTQEEANAEARRFWQRSSWYRRASIRNQPLAGQPLIDNESTQGAVLTHQVTDAAAAGDIMAARRLEDERYAYFAEAAVVFLDLPDAVFRGYVGDEELLAAPREDDPPPVEIIRREVARLEPQRVYFPLGIGNHVDHQLMRECAMALLGDARKWVMPGPDYVGSIAFYEDFPYAWWNGFTRLEDLPAGALASMPDGVSLAPEFADVSDDVERKITGISIYKSQLENLFGGTDKMAAAVRSFNAATGLLGGIDGHAERYWVTTRG